MKYTPDYVIKLDEERTIPLVFNSMAILSFSEEQGFEVGELFTKFNSNQIASILRKGHESYCIYHDLPDPEITKKEVMSWVDALGGFFSPKVGEILEIFMAAAMGKTLKEFREFAKIATQEATKKKKAEAESPNA